MADELFPDKKKTEEDKEKKEEKRTKSKFDRGSQRDRNNSRESEEGFLNSGSIPTVSLPISNLRSKLEGKFEVPGTDKKMDKEFGAIFGIEVVILVYFIFALLGFVPFF